MTLNEPSWREESRKTEKVMEARINSSDTELYHEPMELMIY